MTCISHPSDFCTVIVTVDADANVIGQMEPHAREGLTWFADFNGFVSGALHRSTDGSRLIQYLQWKSEKDHMACMNHPSWDDNPSSRRFMEFVESGQARVDVRVYDVVSTGIV